MSYICFVDNHSDSLFHLILEHRREDILELQAQWPNALVTDVRYTSAAKEAIRLAELLCGTVPTAELQWVQPIVYTIPSEILAEDDSHELADEVVGEVVSALDQPALAPEQVLLADALDGDINVDDNDEEDMMVPIATLMWQLPSVSAFD